jgi:hypothetical protein
MTSAFKYFIFTLLGLAALIALGAAAQSGTHEQKSPQYLTTDPDGGKPGPP